jgi:hypothetical protein
VIATLEWPNRSWTIFGCTFEARRWLAWLWRSSCSLTFAIIQNLLDKLASTQPASVLMKGLKELSRDRSGHAMGKQARSSAWLDAELLFRFRNSFMHSKPGWDDQTDVHNSKLMKELKTRVPVTPSYQSNFMFPYGFLTYGCAKWAVESARAFSAEFCALIDVNDRFAGSRTGSFFHNFRYAVQPAARCPIVKLGWEKQRRDSQ